MAISLHDYLLDNLVNIDLLLVRELRTQLLKQPAVVRAIQNCGTVAPDSWRVRDIDTKEIHYVVPPEGARFDLVGEFQLRAKDCGERLYGDFHVSVSVRDVLDFTLVTVDD